MRSPPSGDTTSEITFEVFETTNLMSRAAADVITDAARDARGLLWCVATGSTPTQTYELLAAQDAPADLFEHVRVLKLDEWYGLDMNDPATCEQYIQQRILDPLGISEDRYIGFESAPEDPAAECQRIRRWLRQHGPIDLCLLGLGGNGHLGLNEPAPSLTPFSHVAHLSAHSRQHAMLEATQTSPRHGMTLGLAEILQARKILLLVNGAHKRAPLARLAQREVSTQFPASLLWLHPHVRCLCDAEAAADLSLSYPS